MKKALAYTILALTLSACSQDGPKAPDTGDTDELLMTFRPMATPMSRSNIEGVYISQEYPVNNLYLTAFLKDNDDCRQYYFKDWKLDFSQTGSTKVWTAPNWYWPLQGEMWFLSYWCSAISMKPELDTIEDTGGKLLPRMIIDATGDDILDGKTDFLYLSQTGVQCPQIGTTPLIYQHGLTWITISLQAEVLKTDGSGQADPDKTTELINSLTINKVVIEDCARKGIATIVPTNGISWKISEEDVYDQVYYNDNTSKPLTEHTWVEIRNAGEFPTTNSLAISNAEQHLGKYGEDNDTYNFYGLLIIPQNKTAITIDYTVDNQFGNEPPIHKVERYELRDNTVAWRPGYHYNYAIVFRNYEDFHDNFDVIETWKGVATHEDGNLCYETSWGGLYSPSDNSTNPSLLPMIVTEPLHDGGSATGDEMDYEEGKRVF